MQTDKYNIMYTNTEIEGWELSLGRNINEYHRMNPLPSTAVCVLDGGMQLFTRVVRYAAFDLNLDFCKVSSYYNNPKVQRFRDNSGIFELPIEPNQRVYIFLDGIDTGNTAKNIAEYYEANCNPAELILCTIFDKNKHSVENLTKYYSKIWSGFHINQSDFLVGYGMPNSKGFMWQSPTILRIKEEMLDDYLQDNKFN